MYEEHRAAVALRAFPQMNHPDRSLSSGVDEVWRLKLKVHSFMLSHSHSHLLLFPSLSLSLVSFSLKLLHSSFSTFSPPLLSSVSFFPAVSLNRGCSWKFSCLLSCHSRLFFVFLSCHCLSSKPALSKTLWAFELSCQGGT